MTLIDLPTPVPYDERDWDPSKYLSYTSLTLHRQCPEAWAYRYIRGLSRAGASAARDFGSFWHLVRAMDSIHRGRDLGSLRYVPERLSVGVDRLDLSLEPNGLYRLPSGSTLAASTTNALTLAEAYWRTLSGDEKDAWVEALGEPLADRLAYMNERYTEQWAAETAREAPLGVEVRFKVPVPGSDAVMPGAVDLIYLDTKRNLVVVRDHKAQSKIASMEAADDLNDSQLHLYSVGVAEVVAGWEGVGPVAALSYDRARSAKPKTPAVTAMGALSKSVTDYDLHTYRTWAYGVLGAGVPWGEEGAHFASGPRKGLPKWGHYREDPEVVEKLSSPVAQSIWFHRTLTPLNRNVIRSHMQSVRDTQVQAERTIATFAEHGEAPRNFNRMLCGWCDYNALCRAELLGGPGGDYPVEQFNLVERQRNR